MLLVFVAIVIYYFAMPKDVNISDIDLLRVKTEMLKDIIEYCTIFFGMGTALLGVRKIAGVVGSVKGKKAITMVEENLPKIEEKEE
jgi:hypothetical protein